MRAWQAFEAGNPADVLRQVDVETPVPGRGQALLRVYSAGLNFPDVLMCKDEYQVKLPRPFTPGVEVHGEVASVGPDCPTLAPGDLIVGPPVEGHGSFAEMTLVDAKRVLSAPPGLSSAELGGFYVSAHTAWVGLHRRAHVREGEVVLVHAAAGGVGSSAVQIGKAAGAIVVAVVGNDSKVPVAEALGADVVVNRETDVVRDVIGDLTEGRGVDIVFDLAGGDAYQDAVRCLAFEGRVVVVGFASGAIPVVRLNHALLKNYSILGLHYGKYAQRAPEVVLECHEALTSMVANGMLRPLIGGRLPFAQVPEGLRQLASGDTVGRLVFDAAGAP